MQKTFKAVKNKSEEKNLLCGKCKATTTHRVFIKLEEHSNSDGYEWHTSYLVVQCQGCKAVSFSKVETDCDNYFEDDLGNRIYNETISRYPNISNINKKILSEGIPKQIFQVYSETYSALCGGFGILTAIGIRALIEILCKDKKAKGKDLSCKIDDLVKEGYLSQRNATYLHGLRIMGNSSAHEAKVYKEKQLKAAFDIVEHLIETVYVIPSKAEMIDETPRKNPGLSSPSVIEEEI